MIFRIIKGLTKLFIILYRINWLKLARLYNRKAPVILWVPRKGIKYFFGNAFVWDTATVNAFIKNNISFRIFYSNKIGKLHNKTIFHTVNRSLNIFGFANQTHIYQHVLYCLQTQGNMLYPTLEEVNFWENKVYMHRKFEDLNIREPFTELYNTDKKIDTSSFVYPFLVKAEHSASSQGLYKISTLQEFEHLISSDKFKMENEVLIKQQLINMRKDLRVILVGGEIVHYYWRINLSGEWKPTSTSFGSKVDFGNFPEQWRQHIIDTFKKLELTAGAFDITWEGDDLSQEPLYLEVSPVFQPNPKIEMRDKSYAYFKKKLSPFNEYDRNFIDLVFAIKDKYLRFVLNKPLKDF